MKLFECKFFHADMFTIQALCRTKLLTVILVLVDTWMPFVKPLYKL